MIRFSVLDRLAATIEAVGSDQFYPVMCEYLRECMEFDNVIVVIFVGSNVPYIAHTRHDGPDVFRLVDEQYLSGAYLLDPVYHFHLKHGDAGLYRLADVAPDQFRSSRYYKWYYGRIGISDEITVFLPVSRNSTVTISMGKDTSSGTTFSQKSEDNLRKHKSVIMALLRTHWHTLDAPHLGIPGASSLADSLRQELKSAHGVSISTRQAEVALLILQGHSSPSMGLQLGVSTQTVKVFRKQLYRRCGISSQAELFSLLMPMLGKANIHNEKS
ncbi:transcriptional regulator, LuxR family (plasmid) [Rhizobium leguminosarum bv. trifolii WSM2304]|uniref:Transcriptional regulator, LuxR family n=1 Tax=Rhizobium leguminosarum bv. trifolii (strain WSM2304) TaxID=395492 RepID=A0ABF7QVM6_RHILW|nr:helix-turn-helix transcriptional regulator [Rhizobium leguminosarum]ACI58225.1 transcriptional regulator, LuxR family [Rhizobium leguminosarum bv. trifolii WSM2304]